MIKSITYQGANSFSSNLYALEVKSRFIDQANANGYYKGYENEINATAVGNKVIVSTGAFVIQGRMNEIISDETIEIKEENFVNGYKGYLCAKIETFEPVDFNNCSLVFHTASDLSNINLIKNDVYSRLSETVKLIYECPLYSFEILNGQIVKLTKLIKPINDYELVSELSKKSAERSQEAVDTANSALTKADAAINTSNAAFTASEEAKTAATNSASDASKSKQLVEEAKEAIDKVVEAGGTQVLIDNVRQTSFDATNLVRETDTIILDCGGS